MILLNTGGHFHLELHRSSLDVLDPQISYWGNVMGGGNTRDAKSWKLPPQCMQCSQHSSGFESEHLNPQHRAQHTAGIQQRIACLAGMMGQEAWVLTNAL